MSTKKKETITASKESLVGLVENNRSIANKYLRINRELQKENKRLKEELDNARKINANILSESEILRNRLACVATELNLDSDTAKASDYISSIRAIKKASISVLPGYRKLAEALQLDFDKAKSEDYVEAVNGLKTVAKQPTGAFLKRLAYVLHLNPDTAMPEDYIKAVEELKKPSMTVYNMTNCLQVVANMLGLDSETATVDHYERAIDNLRNNQHTLESTDLSEDKYMKLLERIAELYYMERK